jgi:putative ABC transport system permease protein
MPRIRWRKVYRDLWDNKTRTIPVGRGLSAMIGSFIFRRPATPAYSLAGALLWLPMVLLIALVSSLMPARRAVRVSVREALAYE